MSIIDDLVTDRQERDLQRLLDIISKPIDQWTPTELEWFNTAIVKGAYNADDLNRVGNAIQYIADELTGLGYAVDVSPKTDWEGRDKPTSVQMAQYLQDLNNIRSALVLPDDAPVVPGSMGQLTYEEANDIERILIAVDEMIRNMQSTVEFGWAIGTSYVGLYFGTDSGARYLMLENGNMLANDMDELQDLSTLSEVDADAVKQIVIELGGENYLCPIE